MIYRNDLAFIHHEGFGGHARAAAPFLLRELRRAGLRNGLVVDLGCGSGIWLSRLSRAGYSAMGIDRSPAMLALARGNARGARLRRASALGCRLPQAAVITALGEVLNYSHGRRQPSLLAFFRRAARALAPGGVLAFDVLVSSRGDAMCYQVWRRAGNWAVLSTVTEDLRRRTLMRDIVTLRRTPRGWRISRERHTLRVFSRGQIEAALRQAGFRVRVARSWGRLKLAPRRLAFWATRRAPAQRLLRDDQ